MVADKLINKFCEIGTKVFVWGSIADYISTGFVSLILTYYLLKRVLKLEQK